MNRLCLFYYVSCRGGVCVDRDSCVPVCVACTWRVPLYMQRARDAACRSSARRAPARARRRAGRSGIEHASVGTFRRDVSQYARRACSGYATCQCHGQACRAERRPLRFQPSWPTLRSGLVSRVLLGPGFQLGSIAAMPLSLTRFPMRIHPSGILGSDGRLYVTVTGASTIVISMAPTLAVDLSSVGGHGVGVQ